MLPLFIWSSADEQENLLIRTLLFVVCDNNVINGGVLADQDTDCNMACGGSST